MRPRKRPNRANAMAAQVPTMVAMRAETRATRKLIQALAMSWSFSRSEAYQRVEKPPHTVTSREALKL